MADRDWEKELAEIDRRIAAAPAETPPPAPVAKATAARAAVPATREPAGIPPIATAARRPWRATLGVLLRLLVTAALLAAVVVWPYDTRCGPWLAGYLATIGLAGLGAIWTAVASWRHRAAFVHVLALALLATAGVYGAREVLPRIGYAMPDPAHPAMWVCQ
ncbi:MAG: hypothetical protein JO180_12180 [Gemmatirosa sp.]|nr:hypothetical protein [Gemmatirosa sp.]